MTNNAVNVNPPNSAIDITVRGSDFLWAVFAIMLFSDLVMIVWAFTLPRGQRTFHYLPVAILSTASIAYFSMASNLGATPVTIEFYGGDHQNYAGLGATRAVWYARYIDWVITTPLLLLELLLATGLPASDIFATVFMDLVMVITGLVGALVVSSYKWGFFAMGCGALVYIWVVLLGTARTSAGLIGDDVRSVYTRGAAYLSFIWLLYPIAWGLSDGGNVISSDSEMVFYGVLDVVAKPLFIFYHIYSLRQVDLARFGMTGVGVGGVWPNGMVGGGAEKGAPMVPTAPVGADRALDM